MHSEPQKLERFHLSIDSFHDAEGLPIPGPYDNRPERPKIVTGDNDDDNPRAGSFTSPDLDQKVSQHLLESEHSRELMRPGFDFFRPPVPASYDTEDLSMSPAAMFLSSFSPVPSGPARLPDAEGEIVSGYKLGPIIAYGGFSTIRCASSASGGTVAVKIVRRSDISQQHNPGLARRRLDHEASVWLSLSHEHILPLFSAVHTSYADFFITLYCPAGSLFDIMKRDGRPALPQDDVGTMFRQVVRGLRYLHEVARLVHRDIKLENVLVDEMGVCRIGDFGMSRNIGELDVDDEDLLEMQMQQMLDDDQLRAQLQGGEYRPTFAQAKRQTRAGYPVHLSMIRHHSDPRHRNSTPVGSLPTNAQPRQVFQTGSLPYAAPELLMAQFSSRVDPAQDIWALGVMLYVMLTGRLPFVDTFDPRLQMKILHGVYDVPAGISQGAELVLQGCIERSTSSRWTIAMVDEVAWDVGWGADDTSAPNEAGSASSGMPSGELRPSLETARRRSSSRARRSLSRASVLGDRSRSSSRRNASRSGTRSSRHSPQPHSTLADSIISSTASNSSVPFDHHQESALSTSPTLSRGRRAQREHGGSTSRSPSPSVPRTPIDFVGGVVGHPLDDVMEDEPSRGRPSVRYAATPRPTDTNIPQHLDVVTVNETSRQTTNPEKTHIFTQFLRRLNPFTYLRDQNSNSTSAIRGEHGDAGRAPEKKGNYGGTGNAPLTNSTAD